MLVITPPTFPRPTQKIGFGGSGGPFFALFRTFLAFFAENGYETPWIDPIKQTYGVFWHWSLRTHTPPTEKCVSGGQGGRGGPRGAFFRTFFTFFAENGYETP